MQEKKYIMQFAIYQFVNNGKIFLSQVGYYKKNALGIAYIVDILFFICCFFFFF